jgi:hypothetical protein
MNVIAVSTPGDPNWRWRIVDHHGQMVEESYTSLPTIAEAFAEGNERLRHHADRDAPNQARAVGRAAVLPPEPLRTATG